MRVFSADWTEAQGVSGCVASRRRWRVTFQLSSLVLGGGGAAGSLAP